MRYQCASLKVSLLPPYIRQCNLEVTGLPHFFPHTNSLSFQDLLSQ